MEESFHQSRRLNREQLAMLMKKDNRGPALHFIIMYALVLIFGAAVVYSWGQAWWMSVTAHLLFAVICCSTFACLHETAHNTAFRSKILNEIAARLAGIAHLYPATAFRELHFTHHRYTHVPGKDPEISLGNRPVPAVVQQLPMYFGWITGLPILLFKIMMLISGAWGMPEFLRKHFFPFVRPEVRARLALESFIMLAMYGMLLWLALFINPGFWGIFTGQVLGHCLLSTYLVPEHNGLPHEGDIFHRTRSMRTSGFVRWLMWNMPYHAEHHAYPGIPYYALPQAHELLKEEIIHRNEGYPGFHLKVLKRDIR